MSERNWLTPPEVASELRLGKSTVYRMVETGQLPGVRIGKCVRIPREELDAFLQKALSSRKAA